MVGATAALIAASLDRDRSLRSKQGIAPVLRAPEELASLNAGLRSTNSSERLASAVCLLQLGETNAGPVLLDLTADADAGVATTAAAEFGRVAIVMGEAIGCLVDWPTSPETPPSPGQLAAARAFWHQKATNRLLSDVQERLAGADWRWSQINGMLAKRDWLYKVADSVKED